MSSFAKPRLVRRVEVARDEPVVERERKPLAEAEEERLAHVRVVRLPLDDLELRPHRGERIAVEAAEVRELVVQRAVVLEVLAPRDLDDHARVRVADVHEPRDELRRLEEMLEHARDDDHVERAGPERQVLGVGTDEGKPFGGGHRLQIGQRDVDGDAEPRVHRAQICSIARADVEDASPTHVADELAHQVVAVVAVRLERLPEVVERDPLVVVEEAPANVVVVLGEQHGDAVVDVVDAAARTAGERRVLLRQLAEAAGPRTDAEIGEANRGQATFQEPGWRKMPRRSGGVPTTLKW